MEQLKADLAAIERSLSDAKLIAAREVAAARESISEMRREITDGCAQIALLRKQVCAIDGDFDAVVARVSKAIIDNTYREVGRSVAKGALWIIGLAVLSLAAWLGLTGKIRSP